MVKDDAVLLLGVKDLMVGAGGTGGEGRAYVLFLDDDIRKPVEAQASLGQERFGFNVLGYGDSFGFAITTSSANIDGDSHDDLVIAAQDSGEVFLFWGNVTSLLTSNKSFTDIDVRYYRSGRLGGCEEGGGKYGIVCEVGRGGERGVQYTKVGDEGLEGLGAVADLRADLDGNGVNELLVGDYS